MFPQLNGFRTHSVRQYDCDGKGQDMFPVDEMKKESKYFTNFVWKHLRSLRNIFIDEIL